MKFGGLFSRQGPERKDDNKSVSFVKKAEDVSSVVEIKYQSTAYNYEPFVNELVRCLKNHGGEVILRLHNDPYHSEHYFRVEDNRIVTIPIKSPALIKPMIEKLEHAMLNLGCSAIKIVNLGVSHNQSTKVGQFFDAGIRQAADLETARKMCQTSQAKVSATQEQAAPILKPLHGMKIR